MSNFTPGPWTASGVRIAASRLAGERLLVVDAPTAGGVAYVVYSDRKPGDHNESHGIQRLIAAAPEMYEALHLIVEELEQCNGGKGPRLAWSLRTLEIAKPALLKAEGKQP